MRVRLGKPGAHVPLAEIGNVHREAILYGGAGQLGRLTKPTGLAADLHRLIDAHAEPGERRRDAGAERKRLLKEGVSELVLAERERQGWRLPREKLLEVFALDIELNAQGLASWLDSEGK